MSATPTALPWFSNLATVPAETTPPFDLTLIQPVASLGIVSNDMLEVTIWDLYEPGKPHTFPSRVDAEGKIAVPHLDSISVVGKNVADVETALSESYIQADILKQPRILVRELPTAPVPVYVTGSVLRPGLLNLPRRNASVFTALVSAGGLSRQAGSHVQVANQSIAKPIETVEVKETIDSVDADLPLVAGNSGLQLPVDSRAPIQTETSENGSTNQRTGKRTVRFQSEPPPQSMSDMDLDLPPEETPQYDSRTSRPTHESAQPDSTEVAPVMDETIATRPDRGGAFSQSSTTGQWYDLTSERDRELLKNLVLKEGDVITVRAAARPVRITGAVAQPGTYRTPASNTMTIVDAVELAGGFTVRNKPATLILSRPANGETGLQRWTFTIGDGHSLPANAPYVQPGDVLHVEPTARARVQSVVDAFRPSRW